MALLRLEEAAVRLGISYGQMRGLITNGHIKATKVGVRSVRIEEDEIKRHVESGGKAVEKS